MKQSRQSNKQEEANLIRRDLQEKASEQEKGINCADCQWSVNNAFTCTRETGLCFDADGLLEAQQICGNKYVQYIASGDTKLNQESQVKIDPDMGNISGLENNHREKLERLFNKDLSNVRIHTGPGVNTVNQHLGAKAFTIGNHIFPDNNELNLSTGRGQKIIAHEITHVLQNSDREIKGLLRVADPHSPYEQEARDNSEQFLSGSRDLTVTDSKADGNLFLIGEEVASEETSETAELEALMEQATGGGSGDVIEEILEETSWFGIHGEEAEEINSYLSGGQRDRAVSRLWEILLTSLPSDTSDRISVTYTLNVGTHNGESVTPTQGADAVALAYVRRKPECASLSGNEEQRKVQHRSLHSTDEINVLIQIGPTVFHTDPEEQLPTLQSTLMHEYTHARQYLERGINQNTAFRAPVGDCEFLDEEYSGTAEEHRIVGEDEIEAYASEIEHAGVSGLGDAFSIEHAINGLWDSYATYYSGVSQNPDPAIAQRVQDAVENGRAMYWDYLHGRRGAEFCRLINRTPVYMLEHCPSHYDASKIQGFVTGYAHVEYIEAGD